MAGIIKEISEQNASELVELATRTFYDTFGSYYDDKDFDQFFKDNYTVEKFTQEHNKHKIWLGVWEHNPSAQAFYKRHGFKVVGEHHFQTGDVTDTDLIMEKEL